MKRVVNPIKKSRKRCQQVLDEHRIQSSSAAPGAAATTPVSVPAISIDSRGLEILRNLHKQVLPFILRRLKCDVARDLPPKTIIDVKTELSVFQRKLYDDFLYQSTLSEDALVAQLKKALGAVDSGYPTITLPPLIESAEEGESNKKLHPFQAMVYLKLLSIHPALVIPEANKAYRKRLMVDPTASGKMVRLVHLLVDSQVVSVDECEGSLPVVVADDLTDGTEADEGENGDGEDESSTKANGDDDKSDKDDDDDDHDVKPKKPASRSRSTTTRAPAVSARSIVLGSRVRSTKRAVRPSVAVQEYKHKCLIFCHHRAVIDLIETVYTLFSYSTIYFSTHLLLVYMPCLCIYIYKYMYAYRLL